MIYNFNILLRTRLQGGVFIASPIIRRIFANYIGPEHMALLTFVDQGQTVSRASVFPGMKGRLEKYDAREWKILRFEEPGMWEVEKVGIWDAAIQDALNDQD